MIAGTDGRVQCSTANYFVGLDFSNRPYFQKAQATRGFVFSDFMLASPDQAPIVMAAYPVSAITGEPDSVLLASVNLEWMSKIMSNLGNRPGISAVLVDSTGHRVGSAGRPGRLCRPSARQRAAAVGDCGNRDGLGTGHGRDVLHCR